MKPYYLTMLAAIIFAPGLFGQKSIPFKSGKIDAAELMINKCPIDSGADAYVIGDYGNVTFNYVQDEGFKTVLQRHIRIKILKKSAFGWADITIPLYFQGTNEEKIESLKGNTFNLEDGKVVVSELEKNAIFKEEVNENIRNLKFTLPNVKEGSILEFSYKLSSDFMNISDWYFQRTIPILKSQYQVEIPEYFKYKTFQSGYESIKSEFSNKSGYVVLTSKYRSGDMVTSTTFTNDKVEYQVNVSTFTTENVPAFHDEPYMKSRNNYITYMEFELQSVKMPGSLARDFTSDWDHINTELLKHEKFGSLLSQGGTSEIESLFSNLTSPPDKATAIFEYVRDNIQWNGYNRLFASKPVRKVLQDKSGNSADINLLLVNLLKKANLTAYPVILSTRDNGMVIMEYPVLQKLNYTIACVELDGKQVLLDATDKHCSFGFLPDKCLNDHGRIIDEAKTANIDLVSNQKYTHTVTAMLKLDKNGELTGNWNEMRKGYCAYKSRKDISLTKGMDEYIENIQKGNQGLTVNNYNLSNKDSLEQDLKLTMDISVSGKVETTGDLMIIHPMLFEQLEENPFKYEKRNFPVDFSYNYAKTYLFRVEIPEGYKIESLPKPANIALPENAARFSYLVEGNANYIQVMRKYNINQVIFLPADYVSLKEFYNQMVNKEAEVIVLKKI